MRGVRWHSKTIVCKEALVSAFTCRRDGCRARREAGAGFLLSLTVFHLHASMHATAPGPIPVVHGLSFAPIPVTLFLPIFGCFSLTKIGDHLECPASIDLL